LRRTGAYLIDVRSQASMWVEEDPLRNDVDAE